MTVRTGQATIVHVLREDSDLAEAIPAGQRDRAAEECIAQVARIERGNWSGEYANGMRDGVGLLVLDGLLVRRVGVDGRFGAELLGTGDLLRPWEREDMSSSLPRTTGWSVLEPARLAVLDFPAAQRMARYPQLMGRLVARAVQRSRFLAVNMAIVHHPRADVRVHMLLWHLADRWGIVRPDGTLLPLRLTHAVLADLVAAQRPTISSAVSDLARREVVQATSEGWLLQGEPPGELLELREAPAPPSTG